MSLLVVSLSEPLPGQASDGPLAHALGIAEAQGFVGPERFTWADGSALWFQTPGNARGSGGYVRQGDRFAAYVGTLHWRSMTGAQLLAHLLAEHDEAPKLPLDEMSGSFAMLYSGGSGVWLFNDALGLQKIFHAVDRRIMSTSFMLCRAASKARDVDRARAQEYVLFGANHGLETPLRGVNVLDPTSAIELSGSSSKVLYPPRRLLRPNHFRRFEDAVDAVSSVVEAEFTSMVGAFGKNVGMALSGGFDSRLLLAALDKVGVEPSLFVYGADGDSDVRVALQVAAKLGIGIECIDKSKLAFRHPALDSERLRSNLDFFDGLPPDGALDRGMDRATRLMQVENGRLNLNGGGGEILRNFFLLPDRPYTASELVSAFYSNWRPDVFPTSSERMRFLEMTRDGILDSLGYAISGASSGVGKKLARNETELVYTLFRLRHWMGRNNSLAARYGLFLTPLVTPRLVALAASLPLGWKTFGRLEAAVIKSLSPRVAAGPSSYGFDFAAGPDFAHRLRVLATLWRPIALRRRSAQVRKFLRLSQSPKVPDDWRSAAPGSTRQDLLVAEHLTSDDQLNRLLTLWFLLTNPFGEARSEVIGSVLPAGGWL